MSEIQEAIKRLESCSIIPFDEDSQRVCNLAIHALKKQIPKKPVYNCNNEVIHCPNCDYDLMGGIEIDAEEEPDYCWKCGQKLDWSDEK